MGIEVELSPVVTTKELMDLARMVDDAGVGRPGISDVALFRDSSQLHALVRRSPRRFSSGAW